MAGVLLGLALKLNLPVELARYTAVGILAALDSLLGALRAELEGHFDTRIFLSGFYTNALLAAGLAFLGDRLGIDLSLVALFAFGGRSFQNGAAIPRHLPLGRRHRGRGGGQTPRGPYGRAHTLGCS